MLLLFECRDSEFLVHAQRWIAGGPTSLSVFVVIRPWIEVDAEPDLAAGLVVPPPDIDDKAPVLVLVGNGSSHEHRGQSVAGHAGRHHTTRVSLLNCDPSVQDTGEELLIDHAHHFPSIVS